MLYDQNKHEWSNQSAISYAMLDNGNRIYIYKNSENNGKSSLWNHDLVYGKFSRLYISEPLVAAAAASDMILSLYLKRNAFSVLVSYVNLNQRSISFPTVYNMSMFGEINDFCYLSSDVIVRPKYAPDTLTKSSMHTQINSWYFAKKTQVDSIFRSEVVR